MSEGQVDKLQGFRKFGVTLKPGSSNQYVGNCVFCGKEDKLFVNKDTQLWDCKVCGVSGNYLKFLFYVATKAQGVITVEELKFLSQDRKLPLEAFKTWGIGKWNNLYTLPVKDNKGQIQDVRTFQLGKKLLSAPGANVGLFNIQELEVLGLDEVVYICEGEWDAIALNWLLKSLKKLGVVVGVPGANTFKKEWIPSFKGKEVICLYDNDAAGEQGEILALQRLTGCARSLKFIHWLPSNPPGYDIRDFIAVKAIQRKQPRGVFSDIQKLLKPIPRKPVPGGTIVSETQELLKPIDRTVTLEKVFQTFEKWMYKPSRSAIEMVLSTVISNDFQGDPLWLFLVAPPGGSKTEILMAFEKCTSVYSTSSLTPHALISGANFKGGRDMSLIPELDGKVLFVKDFTSILGKREVEKDEIFGILRDAYDGKCGKKFGTGVHRYYNSHFSIVAGVTTSIYELSSQYSGLGERFVKFFIGDNLVHQGEKLIIDKAMDNVNKELDMRDEIAYVVRSYVEVVRDKMRSQDFKLPRITRERKDQIISLAQFMARMRAIVVRDRMNSEMVLSKPSAEVGSRLGKQLIKIALSNSVCNGQEEIGEHQIDLIKKVALDTLSQRNEGVLKVLYEATPTEDDAMTTKEVAFTARYPFQTIIHLLNDMYVLDIVKKLGVDGKSSWTVSDYVKNLIRESKLYESSINHSQVQKR